mmetsp:Transcript_16920/g.20876  ORF Transcript_16920/g.20876 Transcript_16920/m.20876 type:complete len:88 (+) Transcript_16920:1683-1946(+)
MLNVIALPISAELPENSPLSPCSLITVLTIEYIEGVPSVPLKAACRVRIKSKGAETYCAVHAEIVASKARIVTSYIPSFPFRMRILC